jgi:hypothetical protein
MNTIYPSKDRGQSRPHYVEFNRADRPNEFTIFRRQFLKSDAELDAMIKKHQGDYPNFVFGNEVHPWNIFTSTFGPDGCVPDKAWVCWMVDALNDKWEAEIRGKTLSNEINS